MKTVKRHLRPITPGPLSVLRVAALLLAALSTNLAAEPQGTVRPLESSVLPEDALSPVNHVYQFVQPGSCSAWDNGCTGSGKAYLWIPDHCRRLKGLLILSPNVPEQKLIGHPAIRKACADNDLGTVLATGLLQFSPPKPDGKRPTEQPEVIAAFLQEMLDGLAMESGYREVATVPWMPMGESTNLILVNALLKARPDHCFAAMWIKDPSFSSGNWTTPGLCAWGTSFEWGQDKRDIRTHWKNVDQVYSARINERAQHPQWPLSFIVDGSSGHFDCSERLTQTFARYIDSIAKARLADDGTTRPLDLAKGFTADLPVPGHEGQSPRPASKNDAAPWFPNEAFAKEAQSYADINWKAETQLPAFLDEKGSVRPFNLGGITAIKEGFTTEADGVTFTMRGVMLEKIPEGFVGAGEPLATTPGAPTAEWVSGPFVQLGDGRFRLALERLGGSHGHLALRKAGTDSIRSVVQPAHIELKPNTQGATQTINFPSIPDQRVGTASITLDAVSDSGMPVSYYVVQGPARIVGESLVFTPIPPRSRFPIKCSVVAWQWGRAADPAVKTATKVTRSFYLTKEDIPLAPTSRPPVALSGLRLWLAADSGITKREDDAVIRWHDQSPASHVMAVPGEAGNPRWLASGINGKPVVRFEGGRMTALGIQCLPEGLAGDITVYAVWGAPTTQQDPIHGGVNNRILSSTADGGEDWTKGIVLANGTNSVIPPKLSVRTFPKRPPLTDLSLGGMLHSLGGFVGSYFTGDLAELVICSGTIRPEEDAALRTHLTTKYGLEEKRLSE